MGLIGRNFKRDIMPIDKEGAYEIAVKIGLNWDKDPHWKKGWFTNMQEMIYLAFQDYNFNDVCREIVNFLQTSEEKKCPSFGIIHKVIVNALGSDKIKSYRVKGAVGCGFCDNGRRGVVCRFYKRADPKQQIMSWSTRCTCAMGDIYRKSMCTFEQMQDWLLGPRPDLLLLAFAQKNDPVYIELHGIYVSNHKNGFEEYSEENKGPWSGHETLTEEQFYEGRQRPHSSTTEKRKRLYEKIMFDAIGLSK